MKIKAKRLFLSLGWNNLKGKKEIKKYKKLEHHKSCVLIVLLHCLMMNYHQLFNPPPLQPPIHPVFSKIPSVFAVLYLAAFKVQKGFHSDVAYINFSLFSVWLTERDSQEWIIV